MLKAIRDFMIYDMLVAVIMILKYILLPTGWAYFWAFIIYLPTIYLFQPIIALVLGYRAVKKYELSWFHFSLLTLLAFIINFFTLAITSIDRIVLYGLKEALFYSLDVTLLPACFFLLFYWIAFLTTKIFLFIKARLS